MSFLATVYAGRTRDFTVQIYEADGTAESILATDDVVRVKIGNSAAGDEPLLDLSSIEPSSNGSSITFVSGAGDSQGSVTVRLAQGDMALLTPGAYDIEIGVVDNSETAPADAFKMAEVGVLSVIGAMAGEVGEEESSSSRGSSESSSQNSSSSSSSV